MAAILNSQTTKGGRSKEYFRYTTVVLLWNIAIIEINNWTEIYSLQCIIYIPVHKYITHKLK